ncbi:MAG: glycerate kinase [Ruminococcaceae bacterium]|nr:glycerate kinase [Oscillospiraceae bacterium]
MRVVIAIDSFKGSLTSLEAGRAAEKGFLQVFPEGNAQIFPIADGGEGTVAALVPGMGGRFEKVVVKDPLGRDIEAVYGIVGGTAIMEMSAAAGLPLLKKEERNPMRTTTYGVGQMILDAAEKGCRDFLIGIGGSATNDCGVGMLQALGFSFQDENGEEVPCGAAGVGKIRQIQKDRGNPILKECRFRIACDVDNPLCGDRGCSAIYGPQKGADADCVREMDGYLSAFAALCKKMYPDIDPDMPGAGAAGGLGFGFAAFLGGELTPGIQLVLDMLRLEDHIREADVVVTGEGRLDYQTLMGKAPAGVAALAKKYAVPVIALGGGIHESFRDWEHYGFTACAAAWYGQCSLQEAMQKDNAKRLLEEAASNVFQSLKDGKI